MADIVLQSPYPSDSGYLWLKGNLHTHSRRSDGQLDIQEVIRRYAALGHDFLQVTDHDVLADYSGLDRCGLVLLRGSEVSAGGPHVLSVGGTTQVEPGDRQGVIDRVNAGGGFAVLCHPDWERAFDHFPIRQLRSLSGYAGIEIFNGGVHWGPGDGYALNKWDMLLSGGRMVWGYATDDAHKPGEIGRAWTVARAGERTEQAVLAALRSGAFYASTGVTIEEISCDGAALVVRAADAEAIAVVGEHGRRYGFVESQALEFDASQLMTPYIRVECFGRGERMAWTQPMRLGGPVIDRLRELLRARPVLAVFRADRPVRLSGRMDDPLWGRAELATQFHLHPLAAEPSVSTEVRAVLAEGVLFLAARCAEPNLEGLKISATRDGESAVWTDDSMEFFIDVEGWGESYHHIMVNAAGCVTADHTSGRRGLAGLRALAGRYDGGWTVEVAVPVASLGGSAGPGTAWGFNVHRNRTQDGSHMSWSWGGLSYHTPEHFGQMRL